MPFIIIIFSINNNSSRFEHECGSSSNASRETIERVIILVNLPPNYQMQGHIKIKYTNLYWFNFCIIGKRVYEYYMCHNKCNKSSL